MTKTTFFWHRRDLRLTDNAGLYYSLKNELNIIPVFIFDTNILDKLHDKTDARVSFIYQEIEKIKKEYEQIGSSLLVKFGNPIDIWKDLANEYDIKSVYTNRDYEPYAIARDKTLYQFFNSRNIEFKGYKDHVIFDKNEIIKGDGKPYTVYTPYSKKWKNNLTDFYLKPYPTEKYLHNLYKTVSFNLIQLSHLGFTKSKINIPSNEINSDIIKNYHLTRDFPELSGTSKLSIHLRFGTISIREIAKISLHTNEKFLNELIWRDFYQSILYHFPHSATHSFKKQYDLIQWENNEEHYKKWCEGNTGYPIVDAGMRELNQTGFMHNRVRMIVASFLTKHLLIDWRWGEAYFAQKLLDYDMASNVGGWQWAAGSGCDAAPYFRVFNPYLQTPKFDKNENYIKKWVPEYQSNNYPNPIIKHDFARKRILERYSLALNNK